MKWAVKIFPPVCTVCLLLELEIDGQSEGVVAVGLEYPIDSLKVDVCMFSM
jgi:hypothetical protein